MGRTLTTSMEIERGDAVLDVNLEYVANPFVAATYWQPAEGGDVEIAAVTLDGAPFDLTEAEEDAAYAFCERHYVEHQGDDAADYAEYRYDQARDEQMMSAWEAGS
jgi:hypothetical protein